MSRISRCQLVATNFCHNCRRESSSSLGLACGGAMVVVVRALVVRALGSWHRLLGWYSRDLNTDQKITPVEPIWLIVGWQWVWNELVSAPKQTGPCVRPFVRRKKIYEGYQWTVKWTDENDKGTSQMGILRILRLNFWLVLRFSR